MDLTEAQDIKKRWQEYTEELYRKDLHDPDNHDGVITHLEPDILECKVNWALEGSITLNKASRSWNSSWSISNPKRRCCESVALKKPVATGLKRSVSIPGPKKGSAKECSNYHKIALFSHASKVVLKIFETRFQEYMNRELPDVQAEFGKGRGTRDQNANIRWIIKKAREFQKNIYLCFIDY